MSLVPHVLIRISLPSLPFYPLSFTLSLFPSPCGPSLLHHSTTLSSHSISLFFSISFLPFYFFLISMSTFHSLSFLSPPCLLPHFIILSPPSSSLLPHSLFTAVHVLFHSSPFLPHPQFLPTPLRALLNVFLSKWQSARDCFDAALHMEPNNMMVRHSPADNFVKLLCCVNMCGSPGKKSNIILLCFSLLYHV